jgi:signal transduction histidine kinase
VTARRSLRSIAVSAMVLAAGLSTALVGGGVPLDCVLLALGAAAATAVAGGLVSLGLRGRSLQLQILVAGLTAVCAVVAGVLVTAELMFISDHDLALLGPVLLLSGLVAVSAAFLLGAPFERSVDSMAAMTRRLAETPGALPVPTGIVTSELRMLAGEISVVGEQLVQAQQRARQLEESRQSLVTSISHDLRSPIASIRAMAEALEDGVVSDPSTVATYHRALRQESHRLGHLVDDLFELARITSGSLDAQQDLAPLCAVVADAVDGAAPRAAGSGVHVVLAVDAAPRAHVAASELRRVLDNLLDNAIRHTTDGRVVVHVCSSGGEPGDGSGGLPFEISVTDGCGGIPEQDLPYVFDVAFRGDEARTRDSGGGGLGLAIARGLVEARGGRLEVSNVSGGCRFTVRLTAQEVSFPRPTDITYPRARHQRSNLRVDTSGRR